MRSRSHRPVEAHVGRIPIGSEVLADRERRIDPGVVPGLRLHRVVVLRATDVGSRRHVIQLRVVVAGDRDVEAFAVVDRLAVGTAVDGLRRQSHQRLAVAAQSGP